MRTGVAEQGPDAGGIVVLVVRSILPTDSSIAQWKGERGTGTCWARLSVAYFVLVSDH
jgi:hypothetical protein